MIQLFCELEVIFIAQVISGVAPPNIRTEEDFDAGCKYHVAGNVGYVRYFTARIYEFQFYKAMCEASGHYVPGDPDKPLHRCNFYGMLTPLFIYSH